MIPHPDLGKYAGFILPAYGLTIAFFVWIIAASLISARHWRRETQRLLAEREQSDR